MFIQYGYNYGSAIWICWQLIKLFLIMVIFNLVIMPWMFSKSEDAEGWFSRWIYFWIFRFLHFSVYFRLGLCAFLWVCLHCLVEIFETPFSDFTYGFAWGILATQCLFFWIPPIYAFLRWKKYNFIEFGKFWPAYEGMKKRGILTNSYLFFFTGKRFIFAVLCAALQLTNHWGRVLPFFLLQIPSLIIIIVLRPMKAKFHNTILILNEIFLFVYSLLFLIAYKESIWSKGYEWFVISILLIYTTFLSVSAVLEFCRDIKYMF